MKKTILIFGAIIGLVLAAHAIFRMNLMYTHPDFKSSDLVGYASLFIMWSIIYFGVRNYRNNHLDGKISFLKALKTGALICVIASTLYVIVGLAYYYIFAPDFIDVFTDYVLRHSAPEDLATKTAQMAEFKEMYKNPLFAIFITYIEVMPFGLIVALVSAFIVRRK